MKSSTKRIIMTVGLFMLTGIILYIHAQQGIQGMKTALDDTTKEVTGLYDSIKKICYVIAAIVGVGGAVKVYSSFSAGDQDATKKAGYWVGGAVIFAALIFIIDKAFMAQ